MTGEGAGPTFNVSLFAGLFFEALFPDPMERLVGSQEYLPVRQGGGGVGGFRLRSGRGFWLNGNYL